MDFTPCAEQLSRLLPRDRLEDSAVEAADASASRGDRWLIGFSGGADSLTLLLLLWAHWPGQRALITAVHFNHRLRADESDADEAFCREVCEALGVAYHAGNWTDIPASVSEDDARRARFSCFEELRAITGARVLFTGHQLDDIAETQLMRLARGSTSAGLAAPRPVSAWNGAEDAWIVRPLLALRKSDIAAALTAAGVSWREDLSNQEGIFLRNRVRKSVLPAWLHAVGEGALAGAALTRRWMEEDDDALERWLDELGLPRRSDTLNLSALAGRPRALWRRALRRWAPAAVFTRAGFETLLERALAGRDCTLSAGAGFAELRDSQLLWRESAPGCDPWSPAWLRQGTALLLPDGAELRAETVAVDPALLSRLREGRVDPEAMAYLDGPGGELMVRPWYAGDRYKPLGSPGSAKLQDLFTNRHIPAVDRRRIPVICAPDGRIVWVPGFPPADCSKVTDVSVTAVQLTYLRGTSTVTDYS
ncbi:tRNA lysidine(34) synthetase TilS [Opitutaceae bacterium EW11]|nr:tRNA lysidine(34) synthetase TilS [Opitutaceae bacterium EW11]